MEEKKEVANEKKKEIDRKPKYIKQLLKSAELRNKENERRIERQVQKEREAEGEMYADKETFVTGAYRAKMEEMAKEIDNLFLIFGISNTYILPKPIIRASLRITYVKFSFYF